MDPGETVVLVFSIENFGDDVAPDVMAVLTSNDQYMAIEDSVGSFGTLNIAEGTTNTDNYFVVSVNASCPTEYWAEFSLKLYTQNGNYYYQTVPDVDIPVSLPIPTDYTGPDAYGYYAYSSDDSFYDQTPVYDWIEIKEIGTEIYVPNNSDYTQSVSLPFTFKYYGLDYSQVRISTDGWIAFGGGSQTAPINNVLPFNDNVNCMAGVFWDDLYDLDLMEEGEILYYHDTDNHRFIIEWDSIAHNVDGAEPVEEIFQAILLDPAFYPTTTGDGEIIFQYKRVEDSENNTIGIENHSQDIGLQYVYNNSYDPTASDLINEYAIKFTTEPPFIYIYTGDEGLYPDSQLIPTGFRLEQNYPNPFNSNTWINYSIPRLSNVSLKIYNVTGEVVRTLQKGQQSVGKYSAMWNGLNDYGNRVSPGIYFYRLETDNFVETMKLLMIK